MPVQRSMVPAQCGRVSMLHISGVLRPGRQFQRRFLSALVKLCMQRAEASGLLLVVNTVTSGEWRTVLLLHNKLRLVGSF